MTSSAELAMYKGRMKHWLTQKIRYLKSFPVPFEVTREKIQDHDLPDPSKDPFAAYEELTQRLRDPTPENVSLQAIMGTVDLSLLVNGLTSEQVETGLVTAVKFDVASACVKQKYIAQTVAALNNTGVSVSQVVDFPNANYSTAKRVQEVRDAITAKVTEIDIPIDVGLMREKKFDAVYDDLRAVWQVVYDNGCILKPIARVDDLETIWKEDPKWSEGEANPYIIEYCKILNKLQRDLPGGYHQIMAKTSTGFDYQSIPDQAGKDYRGATDNVLGIFAAICEPGDPVGIKAAGKVRDAEKFIHIMKNFGVVRIGCTATERIAGELKEMGYYSHAA